MNQAIYITCALMMVGLLGHSVNATRLSKDEAVYGSQAIVTGNTLAQSVMQEILTKRFDENAATNVTDSTQFTATGSLGLDAGEYASNPLTLDDIDDYRSYSFLVATDIGTYSVKCNVYYVSAAQPDNASPVRTFMKRIDVKLNNPYLPNPVDSSLTVSRIVSYR